MKPRHLLIGGVDVLFGATLISEVYTYLWGWSPDRVLVAILIGHFLMRGYEAVKWWRRT